MSSIETKQYSQTIVYFKVKDFLVLNDWIKSEDFRTDANNEWYIRLNPNYTKDDINYISVYLCLHKSNEPIVRAKYSVRVKDVNNKHILIVMTNINEYEYKPKCNGWGFEDFIKRDYLLLNKNELLPNNVLTLCLVIEVMNESIYKNNICFDFEELLKTGQFSDFRFIIGNKVFNVHKNILSLRSSVLKTMFLTDLKEKEENEVIIEDIDSDVFEEFLNFLYLNKLSKMEEMAEQLLYASDKYNVIQLKTICEDFIISNLNTKNAIKTLIICDKYNSQKLKSNTIQFIANNMTDIENSSKSEWNEFWKTNQSLVNQILEAMAKQLKQMKTKSSHSIKDWDFKKL